MRKGAVPAGRQGFTPLELVVALSLTSILMLSGLFLLSTYLRSYKRAGREAEGLQITQLITTRLVREIRSADRLTEKFPNKITLKYGTSLISYDLKDGKLRRQIDSSSAYLTDTGEIKILSFSYPRPGLVKIKIDGTQTGVFCRNEK